MLVFSGAVIIVKIKCHVMHYMYNRDLVSVSLFRIIHSKNNNHTINNKRNVCQAVVWFSYG